MKISDYALANRFQKHVQDHLAGKSPELIFKSGCCYHFALRLHLDRNFRVIEGCMDSEGGLAHVWLLTNDSQALDVDGVRPRELFIAEQLSKASGNCGASPQIQTICPDVLIGRIARNPLLATTLGRLNRLALSYYDTDNRFAPVRAAMNAPSAN